MLFAVYILINEPFDLSQRKRLAIFNFFFNRCESERQSFLVLTWTYILIVAFNIADLVILMGNPCHCESPGKRFGPAFRIVRLCVANQRIVSKKFLCFCVTLWQGGFAAASRNHFFLAIHADDHVFVPNLA